MATTSSIERKRERERLYNRKRRERWRKQGICQRCGAKKAASGITICLDCLDYNTKSKNKHITENPEKHRAYVRKRLQLLRDNNRCLRCSSPLHPETDEGHVTCFNCRTKTQYIGKGVYASI